ncbi:hypothetical protein JXA88_11260 [Candidatus Fermentibacteria bacterium]|nr:hypothetical protein [Candidatus Fermentibacteria bacterium]
MNRFLTVSLTLLFPLSAAFALDMSDRGMLTGQLRLGLRGNDKFGNTIGHELPAEHELRMQPLESDPGFGVSFSYRRGITPSVLLGFSLDYLKSGVMEGKGVEDVENRLAQTDSLSTSLGAYSLYGVGVSLYPGVSIGENLMVFVQIGVGGYTARIAGNSEELNAALNLGLSAGYYLNDSWGIELAAQMPLFLAEFRYLEEGYSFDPSPLQLCAGVAWLW